MLSSSDVAQMFAAQNQMFMGQSQYAQQIGVSNPNMSLAAWGTDPRQKAMGPGGTFGGHAPVSFGGAGMGGPGYGGGSKFAGGAMSALGGVASGGMALAMNPIGAFMGGAGMTGGFAEMMGAGGLSRGIGAMAGGGMAGGALAASAAMLPLMAAQKYVGSFMGGAQEQRHIQSSLSGFGFANSQSRTGQGFSRDDAQSIGNQVRAIAHVPEMMTSVEELTKLIPKLKSSGMMAGVRDASEFNSRFKEAVKTLRDVSKVMGTTMEEATQFFEHSRSVGMLGRTDQIKNAMNVQFTAAQTGMSTQQVMQLQQGGAQMAVGRGVRRSTGATAVTNIAQQFGRAMQAGRVSQDDLEDMTGVPGEAAVGAASQQMVEKLARFAESTSAGRASMMGLADFDEKGRYKGINKELAQKYAQGEVSKEDLMKRIGKFTSQQKIAASRKVGSMAIEFAGATGPGGSFNFMSNVLAEGGHTGESAKYMMQKSGFSEVEVDIMSEMQGMQGGAGEDRQKKAFERKRRMEADISERTDPSKIMSRIGSKLKSGTGLARAEQEGSKMFTFIGQAYDEFVDDVVGRYSAELSEKGAQRLLQSFQSQKGKEDMKKLFALKAPQYTTANSASTMGKLLGGMQMGVELMTTGGLSLLATGGLNAHGKRFDESMKGVAGFFSGAGREGAGDIMQQREFMQKSFGMEGAEAPEINARMRELQGMGGGANAAKDQMRGLITGLNKDGKFREASQADRLKMLTEEMEGATSTLGFGGNRMKEIQKFMKEKGLKSMAEAAMALSPEGAFSGDFNDVEASMRDQAKAHSKSIQAADIHMGTVFGSDTAKTVSRAIASDMEIGTNLRAAVGGDRSVIAALDEKDPEKGARLLEKALGKPEGSVSTDEFKKTQEAHDRIADELKDLSPEERERKKNEMISAIASRQVAEYTKNIGVTQIAARDLAAGMGDGDLKATLKSFANSEGGADAGEKLEKVQDAISRSVAEYAAAKGDKGKMDALQKKVGSEIFQRISQSASQFDRGARGLEGKTVSKAEAASQLGVSEDDLKGYGSGSDIKLDKETLAKIKGAKVSATVAGGALVGTADQKKEEKDVKLNKTLDELNVTMSKTNTLLAIQGGMKKEEAEKTYAVSSESKALESK